MMNALTHPDAPTFERRSPLNDQVVSRATAATAAQAVAAADRAAEAFVSWSRSGPNQRRALLQRAAELLEQRSQVFVDTMVAETGTSATWAQFNVRGALALLRESAALTTQVGGNTIPSDQPGCLTLTLRVPAGVVLGIAPWNAPLLLGLRAIAMPLACGNTVLLKASEQCPASHWLIGELMRDAGFPDGVVQVVTHAPENAAQVVESLVAHPAVRRVNFTGSTQIGRVIGALAGRHLKPTLLELGGKSPLVVLADADIDHAVQAAAFGAFMNQGQICMSTERIVVDESIADAFVQALAHKTVGLADQAMSACPSPAGALISAKAATYVQELIADAVAQGARQLTPPGRQGVEMTPVVLDGVTPAMRVYAEESFGPIAAVVRVRGIEEAIRVANDSDYGLAGAVFGRDIARTLAVAQRLEVGICHINGATVRSEPQVPFGGVKASGYGRFGGTAAIQEFTDLRSLTIQTQPAVYPA